MKKFLCLIIIIAGVFYIFKGSETEVDTNPVSTSEETAPDPSSATFSFDDGAVTLSSGKSEKEDEESGLKDEIALLEEKASGDLNNDGKEDSVVLMARSGGGSGVFIYIAAYVSGPVSYKGTNALFIGDRISPESVFIQNGIATLKYLDREPDEPFAAEPTVPKTIEYIYKNGEFVEK